VRVVVRVGGHEVDVEVAVHDPAATVADLARAASGGAWVGPGVVIDGVELPGSTTAFHHNARDIHLDGFPEVSYQEVKKSHCLLAIQAPENTRALAGIDPEALARAGRARKPLRDQAMKKRWCSTRKCLLVSRIPPLRRVRSCSPSASARTVTAHSLKAIGIRKRGQTTGRAVKSGYSLGSSGTKHRIRKKRQNSKLSCKYACLQTLCERTEVILAESITLAGL